MYKIQPGFRWASDSTDKFIQALNSEEMENLITTFINKKFETTKDGCNLAINEINYIYKKAACKTEFEKENKTLVKYIKDDKWFDSDCKH